jgi:hypothetical protein
VVSTHRDDCGKLFAHAALRPTTFGKADVYNATRQHHTTWSEYYRQVSAALGKAAQLIYMPRGWIVRRDPERFGLLKKITGFHGAYCSSAARRDLPEFVCDVDLTTGAAEVFTDQRRRASGRTAEMILPTRRWSTKRSNWDKNRNRLEGGPARFPAHSTSVNVARLTDLLPTSEAVKLLFGPCGQAN